MRSTIAKPAARDEATIRRLIRPRSNTAEMVAAVRALVAPYLAGIASPPTELKHLAASLNVVDVLSVEMPYSGELRRTEAGYVIAYSANQDHTRARFTIAHEMGHVILSRILNDARRADTEERICDKIAAEILMPARVFCERFHDNPSVYGIFDLARTFDTSLKAAAIRCYEVVGTPVFEAIATRVVWDQGLSRTARQGLRDCLSGVDTGNREMSTILDRALHGEQSAGDVLVYEAHGGLVEWRLEGQPLGKQGRALFMLYPLRPR